MNSRSYKEGGGRIRRLVGPLRVYKYVAAAVSCNANLHGARARQGCECHKNEQGAAMLSISSSFCLLCAPSRQWPAAESRGPESGSQNLAAVGRVACDLPMPVLVLFGGLSFAFCRTPAVWPQQCGLFFSFYAWRISR